MINQIEKKTLDRDALRGTKDLADHSVEKVKMPEVGDTSKSESTIDKENISKSVTDKSGSTAEKKTDLNNASTGNIRKKQRPVSISLIDKSELFKKVIDIALECEEMVKGKKQLSAKNKTLTETCKKLTEEKTSLVLLLKEKDEQISKLKTDIAHRDEAIGILKADKTESAQEYKNAIAAALKTYYLDFCELKEIGTTDDIGLAVIDVFDGVLKVLQKSGIVAR